MLHIGINSQLMLTTFLSNVINCIYLDGKQGRIFRERKPKVEMRRPAKPLLMGEGGGAYSQCHVISERSITRKKAGFIRIQTFIGSFLFVFCFFYIVGQGVWFYE